MRVIVLCRNAEKAKYLKPMGVVGQITLVSGDACDDETLERVIAPADAVVNLVGILAAPNSSSIASALQAELPGLGAIAAQCGRRECRSCIGHWRQHNLAQHLFPYQGGW